MPARERLPLTEVAKFDLEQFRIVETIYLGPHTDIGYGYIKVQRPIHVDYNFLIENQSTSSSRGQARFFGRNSFVGAVPKIDMVPDLLTGRIRLRVSFHLPTETIPIVTTAKVAWLETIDSMSYKCKIGLTFDEMQPIAKDRLYRHVMDDQLLK